MWLGGEYCRVGLVELVGYVVMECGYVMRWVVRERELVSTIGWVCSCGKWVCDEVGI